MENLLVAIIGKRNSGKSHTWNNLFGRLVRTGKYEHELPLSNNEYVNVFLVSGSPEERRMEVDEIIRTNGSRIILCSIQYSEHAIDTIDYFFSNKYFVFAHWLNPGHSDTLKYDDDVGVAEHILNNNGLLGIRNGNADVVHRVREMKDFIRGWAHGRELLKTR